MPDAWVGKNRCYVVMQERAAAVGKYCAKGEKESLRTTQGTPHGMKELDRCPPSQGIRKCTLPHGNNQGWRRVGRHRNEDAWIATPAMVGDLRNGDKSDE